MVSRKVQAQFGEWLDITLSNRKVMGRTLAEAIGVHDSAVSRWRSGSGVPSITALADIAEFLELDPLRLAVTAGQVPQRVAGVAPYPTPEPTAQRESVRRQLSRIRGLTEISRAALLAAYEELIIEDGGDTAAGEEQA